MDIVKCEECDVNVSEKYYTLEYGCMDCHFCEPCYHKNLDLIESESEETCLKCGTEEEVEQCWKCEKYICIDCDPSEMMTSENDGHVYCDDCLPE